MCVTRDPPQPAGDHVPAPAVPQDTAGDPSVPRSAAGPALGVSGQRAGHLPVLEPCPGASQARHGDGRLSWHSGTVCPPARSFCPHRAISAPRLCQGRLLCLPPDRFKFIAKKYNYENVFSPQSFEAWKSGC